MPGIRTSRIKQSVFCSACEFKKSVANAKASTLKPTDLSNPSRDSRTDSSSSTTEMRETLIMANCTTGTDAGPNSGGASIIPWYSVSSWRTPFAAPTGRNGHISPRSRCNGAATISGEGLYFGDLQSRP